MFISMEDGRVEGKASDFQLDFIYIIIVFMQFLSHILFQCTE